MKMKTLFTLLVTHLVIGAIGFAGGIYALPIITAPDAPDVAEIKVMSAAANYSTAVSKNLQDSDFFHQAEGPVTVGDDFITFMGSISPGPDYQLYLSPQFVETEVDFKRLKNTMVQVGEVKTFDNFAVPVGTDINISKYNTVIVWCESFEQFITAAQYR